MALTQVNSDGIGDGQVKGSDLENSGVSAGTYGSSSAIPAITVDAKGRITSASTNNVNIPPGVGGANGVDFNDGVKARFGDDNDLEIEHTGSASFIRTSTSSAGDLAVEARGSGRDLYLTGADDVLIRPQGGEDGIKVIGNGAVEVYHDNNKKFETTSTGINVTGKVVTDDLHVDGTGAIELPTGTTAERPTGVNGMLRYNTTDDVTEEYRDGQWHTLSSKFSVSGGTETTSGNYTVHTFTSSGQLSVTGSGSVEYLIVAGGGGGSGMTTGGSYHGASGGGGAGGMLTGSTTVNSGTYAITVGAGGASNGSGGIASPGGNSSAIGFSAFGGGRGARGNTGESAGNGGSGGGGSRESTSAGTGTAGQGNDGGTAAGSGGGAGGGGGRNTGGGSGSSNGGQGGQGLSSSISGSTLTYAGGGGGGGGGQSNGHYGGSGGSGGGGGGGDNTNRGSNTGSNGMANRGGGGGGGGSSQSSNTGSTGGSGGSGIVIIRYLT